MAFKKKHTLKVTLKPVHNLEYLHALNNKQLKKLDDNSNVVIEIDNAYYRVDRIQSTKNQIDYELGVYNEAADKLIESKYYSFIPDVSENAINYHTQCYNHAKSLEENKGAIDC